MNAVSSKKTLFPLGMVVMTPGAAALLAESETPSRQIIARHQTGDWGDLPNESKKLNDEAIGQEYRLLSSYCVGDGKIWVITEADRSATTLLLPSEY